MPIIEQISIDLESHTLRLDTDEATVTLDLFSKDGLERATVPINVKQLMTIMEKLGKAGGNAIG